jgi:hypothetical protein
MVTTIERRRPISVLARDVSGQKHAAADAPPDATVGELSRGLLTRMNLPRTDVEGRPLSYHVRLEREGRHLHASETVGEVLQENDQLVLQPKIQAGAG